MGVLAGILVGSRAQLLLLQEVSETLVGRETAEFLALLAVDYATCISAY